MRTALTNTQIGFAAGTKSIHSFSTLVYLLIVLLLSWPLQFWFVFSANTPFEKYLYSSLSMVMVTVATLIYSRFILQDDFSKAGWSWGKPKQYLYVFLFALLLWLLPSILENMFGWHSPEGAFTVTGILFIFLLRFAGTLIPAFGEEFGWRGYLLPRLALKYGAKKGLLLHAFIWWFWHLPVLVGMGLKTTLAGNAQLINVIAVVAVSIIPAMLHAVIFAYIWAKTKSIWLATFYHAAFDEVRDALENSVGLGPLVEAWQMIVIVIVGGLLLWKADWNTLLGNDEHKQQTTKSHQPVGSILQ